MKAPVAKKVNKTLEIHGDVRQDDYYWMREKTNPEVIAHLEAENAYFKEMLKPAAGLTEAIYEQMVARIPAAESQVPVQKGPYFYYVRRAKELQYPIYGRKLAANRSELENAAEEITLDVNQLANADDYLSVSRLSYSDCHQYLAYLENRDGTDHATLYVKDLQTGNLLPDVIPNVCDYGSILWSNCGQYLFYTTIDEMQRPDKFWRHELGTAIETDVLLFDETDNTFTLYTEKSQSGQYIFVHAYSTTTTEVWFMNSNDPLSTLNCVAKRQRDIEYNVEHWGDQFLILTNENAINFKLMASPINDLSVRTEFLPYDETYFLGGGSVYPFKDKLFITGRKNGLTQVWEFKDGELVQLTWDEQIYSVYLVGNQAYDATEILVNYQSLLTPATTLSVDVATGEQTVLQVAPVAGAYNQTDFIQEQIWATAADGVKVPVLLQYKKDALANGPAPLILSAYGSYGATSDPYFSAYRLPILAKGVILATAQVRGGSELGRSWYFDGKMKNKMNTFTDFIAAADQLMSSGYTTADLIAGRGGSAGGLLIGAVANLAGEKFKVLVPEVPFVDVLTTMLDESIPLTTGEWDEWGNPKIAEEYAVMRTYSPYDNVEAKAYPHMYVTTGLNDPRVAYWEPAKWVARLRELKTDDNTLVLKTNMGAGHFGASGRLNELKETAEYYGFVLNKLGVE
jgi:oligopeptidase B